MKLQTKSGVTIEPIGIFYTEDEIPVAGEFITRPGKHNSKLKRLDFEQIAGGAAAVTRRWVQLNAGKHHQKQLREVDEKYDGTIDLTKTEEEGKIDNGDPKVDISGDRNDIVRATDTVQSESNEEGSDTATGTEDLEGDNNSDRDVSEQPAK